MNEAASQQPEALKPLKVSSETFAAKKQVPNTRFGLGHRTVGERKAHQARRERTETAKTQATIKNVREEIVGLQKTPIEAAQVKPLTNEGLQVQPALLKGQKSVSEKQSTYNFTTADKKIYNLNLPTNATLDEVRTALQAQGASDLAAYLDRNVYFPSAVDMDVIQDVAQTFNKNRVRGMRKAETRKNPLRTFNYRRTDGKLFTVTLPKYHTADELVQALRSQGEQELGKGGFSLYPGEPTVAENLEGLLHTSFSDLPDLVKDVWKAIKKAMRPNDKSQKSKADTQ